MKRYYLLTLGCQMNQSDSERIEAILDSRGFKKSTEERADLIIINSCSVRQKPMDRIWGKLKIWNKINPKAKKILTGCVLPNDIIKLKPRFDFYFKIKNLRRFNSWLEKHFSPKKLDKIIKNKNYLELKAKRNNKKIALVPIMTGCNNFCSYCAVPYTRGKEWSRNPNEIVNEIKCLIKEGFKQIMLLGQNVNSYKIKDPKGADDFVELLRKIMKLKGRFKISFLSPHPKDFSDELIELISKEPRILREIHLPLQSGDDKILQKMNRGYKACDYLKLVEKIRKKIPNAKISTDIIIGFPGENQNNFKNTLRIVRKLKFNKAYVSIYSVRPGTIAHKKYKDNVPFATKRKRWLILDKIINKKRP